MPPSPSSSSLSLAARFAFKPSEAAKVVGASSPSRLSSSTSTSTKRRLSTSAVASPTRSSPRKTAAVVASSVADIKGKGKQALSASNSISTAQPNQGGDNSKKSSTTSTSVDLQDDGLDWELSDSELAAISDDLLNSSNHKKIKLDKEVVQSSSPSIPRGAVSSSSSKITTASNAKKVSTVKKGKKTEATPVLTEESQDDQQAIGPAQPSEMPNEVARQFLESLADTPSEGKGGKLSPRQLLELEGRTMHPSWLTPLQKEMRKSYFLELKRFLWTEGVKSVPQISKNIFPPAGEIYSWSQFTPLDKVRVVILGQDPYHNNGQAHGLAFSVRSNVAVPPSLRNIYKEVKNDYPDFQIPKHGYLGSWARQGVLMLNTSLSVRAHQANSHSNKGWEQFTDSILKQITSRPGPGVVFLAWGNPAQKRTASIITSTPSSGGNGAGLFSKEKKSSKEKHLVLKSVHPSPLSANRGFFGNGHFRKANEWLKENYGEEGMINWCTLDSEDSTC